MRPLCNSLVVTAAAALFILAAAEAATALPDPVPSTVTVPHCAWDSPGRNPYMGDVVTAVDRYRDIAPAARERLKQRMARRQYDDIVSIRREAIDGSASYAPTIRSMHFGTDSVCQSVTRTKWTDQMQERGLVYCESDACILVPTVCRNVSRITRLAPAGPTEALAFDDPAAGAMPAGGSFAALGGPLLLPQAADPGGTRQPTAAAPISPPAIDPGPHPGHWTPPPVSPPPVVPPPVVPPAVPEPAQWLQLIAGLALLAAGRTLVRRARPRRA
jgi:hypothetical protein